MRNMWRVGLVAAGILIIALSAVARGRPSAIPLVIMRDGTRYEKARIERITDSETVLIRHSKGVDAVLISNIPDDIRPIWGLARDAEIRAGKIAEEKVAAEQTAKGLVLYGDKWVTPSAKMEMKWQAAIVAANRQAAEVSHSIGSSVASESSRAASGRREYTADGRGRSPSGGNISAGGSGIAASGRSSPSEGGSIASAGKGSLSGIIDGTWVTTYKGRTIKMKIGGGRGPDASGYWHDAVAVTLWNGQQFTGGQYCLQDSSSGWVYIGITVPAEAPMAQGLGTVIDCTNMFLGWSDETCGGSCGDLTFRKQ